MVPRWGSFLQRGSCRRAIDRIPSTKSCRCSSQLLHSVFNYSDYLNINSSVDSISANQNSLGCSLILHCLQTKNMLNIRNENDCKFKIIFMMWKLHRIYMSLFINGPMGLQLCLLITIVYSCFGVAVAMGQTESCTRGASQPSPWPPLGPWFLFYNLSLTE